MYGIECHPDERVVGVAAVGRSDRPCCLGDQMSDKCHKRKCDQGPSQDVFVDFGSVGSVSDVAGGMWRDRISLLVSDHKRYPPGATDRCPQKERNKLNLI